MWPINVTFILDGKVFLVMKMQDAPLVGDHVIFTSGTEGTVTSRRWTQLSSEFGNSMDVALKRRKK